MFDNNTPCHTQYCKKPKDVHKQLDLALTFYDQRRGLYAFIGASFREFSSIRFDSYFVINILLIRITAAQNKVALSYHRVRGLYFLAVIFTAIIMIV